MKLRRPSALLGVILSGALLLGACTSEGPKTGAGKPQTNTSGAVESTKETNPCRTDIGVKATKDGQISFTAGPGGWDGYNANLASTNSTYNNVVAAKMFSRFTYFGTDGSICHNKELGSLEVISKSPLRIKYTISEKAVWSDGTPVTINDYLLEYASQNPDWLVPGYASGKNPGAKPVFNHATTEFTAYIPAGPQGKVGAKTFTVEFAKPNPDYESIVLAAMPAHVVARKAGLTPEALAKAILDRDAATVKKAANFWNTGWTFNPGELPDMADIPSNGPYKIKPGGWNAKQSLTLTVNEKYWGTKPATKELVFRFIPDAQMPQALQNGDVQVIEPQATVDNAKQLRSLGGSVKVGSSPKMTWEHLDFNFRDSSVFSDSKGGKALREAFAYCVPRQTIVDTLIKPIDESAKIMNLREIFPFQKNYDEVVKAAYDGRYDKVDIAKAKAKIAESKISTPIKIRIGYKAGNQRRADTVAAIAASCGQAGFEIQDISSDDFFKTTMTSGDYEVALFAWSGSGQVTSGQNIYATNKGQNYGKYSNKVVDQAWEQIVSTLDTAKHKEQVKILEKELWDSLFGIPLYAHPGLVAWDSKIANVRPAANQDGVSWNASQWVKE